MTDIMRRSTAKMTLVRQCITGAVRKDVADKVGSYIWDTSLARDVPVIAPNGSEAARKLDLVEASTMT